VKFIDPSVAGSEQQIQAREEKEERAQSPSRNAKAAVRTLLVSMGVAVLFGTLWLLPFLDETHVRYGSIFHRSLIAAMSLLPATLLAILTVVALRFSLRSGRRALVFISVALGLAALYGILVSLLRVVWPA
jgi:hypothetical protein